MSAKDSNTIKSLRDEEIRLAAQIRELQARRHELECDAAGVRVGDVVLYKGVEHRVTKVDTWVNPPWLHGNPKRKDGSWGTRAVSLRREWRKP